MNTQQKYITAILLILAIVASTFIFYRIVDKDITTIVLSIASILAMLVSVILVFSAKSLLPLPKHTPNLSEEKKPFDEKEYQNNLKIEEENLKKAEEAAQRILSKVQTSETGVKFSESLLKALAGEFSIVQGIVFLFNPETTKYKFSAGYALYTNEEIKDFSVGEGVSGQVAKNMEMLLITNVPEKYITVLSGLGSSTPKNMLIFPLIDEFDAVGIVEIASFSEFPPYIKEIYKKINEPLGKIASQSAYSADEKEETF